MINNMNKDPRIYRIFLGNNSIERLYIGDKILYDRKSCSRPKGFIGASWRKLFNFIKRGE